MSRPDSLEYKSATLAAHVESQPGGLELGARVANGRAGSGEVYPEVKSAFSLDDDPEGTAWAIVAVTGVEDDVQDIITPGAFARTLRTRQIKGCLGHDWNRPVARAEQTMELLPGDPRLPATLADGATPWPSAAGALLVKARYNLGTADGRDAYEHAKFYDRDHGFSIGYKVAKSRQRKDGVRLIDDLDLYEFSPVLHGANRLATLMGIKGGPGDGMETGDLGGVEFKVKYVRDQDYWGRPIGTPITPGMKPRGRVATALRRKGKTPSPSLGAAPSKEDAERDPAPSTGKASASKIKKYEEEIDSEGLFPEPTPTGRLKADRGAKGGDTVDAAHEELAATFRDAEIGGKGRYSDDDEAQTARKAAMQKLIREGEQPDEVEERLHEDLADDLDGPDGDTVQGEVDDFIDDYRKAARARGEAQDGGQAPSKPTPDPDQPTLDGPDGGDGAGSGGTTPDAPPAPGGGSSGSLTSKIVAAKNQATARQLAKGATDDDLAATDNELNERASKLGKAGQVSKPHQAVKDEIARRGKGGATSDDDTTPDAGGGSDAPEKPPVPSGGGDVPNTGDDSDAEKVAALAKAYGAEIVPLPKNSLAPGWSSVGIAGGQLSNPLQYGFLDSHGKLHATTSGGDADIVPTDMLDDWFKTTTSMGSGNKPWTSTRRKTLLALLKKRKQDQGDGKDRDAPGDTPGDTPGGAPDGPDGVNGPDAPATGDDSDSGDAERREDALDAANAALTDQDHAALTAALRDLDVAVPEEEATNLLRNEDDAAARERLRQLADPDTRQDDVYDGPTGDMDDTDAPSVDDEDDEDDAPAPPDGGDEDSGDEGDGGQAPPDTGDAPGSYAAQPTADPRGVAPADLDDGQLQRALNRVRKLGSNIGSGPVNRDTDPAGAKIRDDAAALTAEWKRRFGTGKNPAADVPPAPVNTSPEITLPSGVKLARIDLDDPEEENYSNAIAAWGVSDAEAGGPWMRIEQTADDSYSVMRGSPGSTRMSDDHDSLDDAAVQGDKLLGDQATQFFLSDQGRAGGDGSPSTPPAGPDTPDGPDGAPTGPDGAAPDADTAPTDLPDTGEAPGGAAPDGADTAEITAAHQARTAAETARADNDRDGMVEALQGLGMDEQDAESTAGTLMMMPADQVSKRVAKMEDDRVLALRNGAGTPDVPVENPDGDLDPDEGTIGPDEIDAARRLENDTVGLIEGDDGDLEVAGDVADRQDRVEALLDGDAAPALASQTTDELGANRRDLVEELRLQEVIRRRDRERQTGGGDGGGATPPTPDGGGDDGGGDGGGDTPPKPKPTPTPTRRPGLAGATEDLADAVESGDADRVTAALKIARSSLNRSANDTEHHTALTELLDKVAAGEQVDPAALRDLAGKLREEARKRRNDKARSRRTAKRLERERLRALIGQYDAELRTRNTDPDDFGGPVPDPVVGDDDDSGTPSTPSGDTPPGDAPAGDTPPETPPAPPEPPAPPAPQTGPEVQALLDSVQVAPHRLLVSDDALTGDPDADMRRSAADDALRGFVDEFSPDVAARSDDSIATVRALLTGRGQQGPGAEFVALIPSARRAEARNQLAQARESYITNLAALRAARDADTSGRPDERTLFATHPERVSDNGRLLPFAPRPMADTPAGTRPFDSVDGAVAHMRGVEHPRSNLPDYDATREDAAREALLRNITSGKESYLSPGGGLLAYRDEDGTPKRWHVVHTGSGVDLENLGRSSPALTFDSGPTGYNLDGPAMRGMLDSLERLRDARGRQIDWSRPDAAEVAADVRAWRDYSPDGSFNPDDPAWSESIASSAIMDAIRNDPLRYAGSATVIGVANNYRPLDATDNTISVAKIGGARRSRDQDDGLAYLAEQLNNGIARSAPNTDIRTPQERREDAMTAKVVTLARLHANSGNAPDSVRALRAEAARLRETGRTDDQPYGGPASPAFLDRMADEISENNAAEDGALESFLHAGHAGSRIALVDTVYELDQDVDGAAPAGSRPSVVTLNGDFSLVTTRDDGTTVWRASAKANGRSPGVRVDDPNDFVVEIDTASGMTFRNADGDSSSRGDLPLTATDSWALVNEPDPDPATTGVVRALSRSGAGSFALEHHIPLPPRNDEDGPEGPDDGGGGGGDDDFPDGPVEGPDAGFDPNALNITLDRKTLAATATPMLLRDVQRGDLVAIPNGRGGFHTGTVSDFTTMRGADGSLVDNQADATSMSVTLLDDNGAPTVLSLSAQAGLSRLQVKDGAAIDPLPDFTRSARVEATGSTLRGAEPGMPVRLVDTQTGEVIEQGRTIRPYRNTLANSGVGTVLIRTPDGRVVSINGRRRAAENEAGKTSGVVDGSRYKVETVLPPDSVDPTPVLPKTDADLYTPYVDDPPVPAKNLRIGDRVSLIRPMSTAYDPETGEFGGGTMGLNARQYGRIMGTITELSRPRNADASTTVTLDDGTINYLYPTPEGGFYLRPVSRPAKRTDGNDKVNKAKAEAQTQAEGEAYTAVNGIIDEFKGLSDDGLPRMMEATQTRGFDASGSLRDLAAAVRAADVEAIARGDKPPFVVGGGGSVMLMTTKLAHLFEGTPERTEHEIIARSRSGPDVESNLAAAKVGRDYVAGLVERMAATASSVENVGMLPDEDVDGFRARIRAATMDTFHLRGTLDDRLTDSLRKAYIDARGLDFGDNRTTGDVEAFSPAAAKAAFTDDLRDTLTPLYESVLRASVSRQRQTGELKIVPTLDDDEMTKLREAVHDLAVRHYGNAAVEASPSSPSAVARLTWIKIRDDITKPRTAQEWTALHDKLYTKTGADRKFSVPDPLTLGEDSDVWGHFVDKLGAARGQSDLDPGTSDHAAAIEALRKRVGDRFGVAKLIRRRVRSDGLANLLDGRVDFEQATSIALDRDTRDKGPGATARLHLDVAREAGRRMVDRAKEHLASSTEAHKAYTDRDDALMEQAGVIRSEMYDIDARRRELVTAALEKALPDEVLNPQYVSTGEYSDYRAHLERRKAADKIRAAVREDNPRSRSGKLRGTSPEIKAAVNAAHAAGADLGKEYDALKVKFRELQDQRIALRAEQTSVANPYLEAMREVRQMGLPDDVKIEELFDFKAGRYSEGTLREGIERALEFYPGDWLRALKVYNQTKGGGKPISVQYVDGRAHFSSYGHLINVGSSVSDVSVMAHEIGHAMERAVPGLSNAEWTLHFSRVSSGAPGERKIDSIGDMGGMMAGEKTRHDQFRNPYTGKLYQPFDDGKRTNDPNDAWEVFTTSLENLVAGDTNLGMANGLDAPNGRGSAGSRQYLDDDLRQWAYGVLTLIPGVPRDGEADQEAQVATAASQADRIGLLDDRGAEELAAIDRLMGTTGAGQAGGLANVGAGQGT